MRAFVTICALFVAVSAKPQYNYNSGSIAIPQTPFNNVQTSGYNYQSGPIGIPQLPFNHAVSTPHYNTHQQQTPRYNTPQNSGSHYNTPHSSASHYNHPESTQYTPQISHYNSQFAAPFSTPQVGLQGGAIHHEDPVQQVHEAPLITKQFFIHSAPEDHSSIGKTKHFVLGRPQKNYRVVFIKAPSDSNARAHLSAEYAPQEEKTVIYVLTQKEHQLDVNDIATPAPTQPSKPEVFFIKYKTPEEAAHAQREIQSQYNVLGGQNQVTDEGTAPVSSVVGALDKPYDDHALKTLGNQYLPTSNGYKA